MSTQNADVIRGILMSAGPMSAAGLAQRTRLSQPTISRAISLLAREEAFLTFRRGRVIFYAIGRQIRSMPLRAPVFHGGRQIGAIMAVSGGGFLFVWETGRAVYSEGLPWFMQDMRPQGYIGRAFCHARAASLQLPERLSDWTDDDVLYVLSGPAYDAPGGISVGAPRADAAMLSVDGSMSSLYDRLAEQSVSGVQPGSSAGGEHAKFALSCLVAGQPHHVIVKFSPSLDGSAVATRWSDLLVCEDIANKVLLDKGFDAAQTRIITTASRRYLESVRFDRGGDAVVSLGAVDDEFIGQRRSWAETARRLADDGLLERPEAEKVAVIEDFGRLIANTDMHFGNLSLHWTITDDEPQFSLAPVYDMLPMLYAPEKAELVPRAYSPSAVGSDLAVLMACDFWEKVSGSCQVSREFAAIAQGNLRYLRGKD